jgi:hypothetical protein
MKKVFAVAAFGALSSLSAFAGEWTGVIVDANCGAKHADASEASAACAERCIKRGTPPVLVTADNKIVKIAADSKDKAVPFAGKKVTVTGKMEGDTLEIESIK